MLSLYADGDYLCMQLLIYEIATYCIHAYKLDPVHALPPLLIKMYCMYTQAVSSSVACAVNLWYTCLYSCRCHPNANTICNCSLNSVYAD